MKEKKKYKASSVSNVLSRLTLRILKSEKETLTKKACELGMTVNEFMKQQIKNILLK